MIEDIIKGDEVTQLQLNRAKYYPKHRLDQDNWLMYRNHKGDRSGLIVKRDTYGMFEVKEYITFE